MRCTKQSSDCLLHSHTLRQIARFIWVTLLFYCCVIAKKLYRDYVEDWARYCYVRYWDPEVEDVVVLRCYSNYEASLNYAFFTLTAFGPLSPCSTSNVTGSLSCKVDPSTIDNLCTKTSFPSSQAMNPNPFAALKNFTVPFIFLTPYLIHS